MIIERVVTSTGRSGFFNWDLQALKRGATRNGFVMEGKPVSPGFNSIVQPGTALLIMLILESGEVAIGDCVDVILTGAAGRDPLFNAEEQQKIFAQHVEKHLTGKSIDR